MIVPLLVALAAPAGDPVSVLGPSGPWIVEADDNMCVLTRNYGDEANRLTVGFQPMINHGQSMEVVLLYADKSDDQWKGKASIRADDGSPIDGTFYSIWLPKRHMRLVRITIGDDVFERLKAASALTITAQKLVRTIKIAPVAKALFVLDQCQTDLLKSWGIDRSQLEAIATPISGNPARYFTPDAYPFEAYSSGIEGRVVAALQVNDQGSVDQCRIVATAGKLLNDGTCRVAMKIKFSPAKNHDGKPVPSLYILPVRWSLPE